jgi:hypothetical protein
MIKNHIEALDRFLMLNKTEIQILKLKKEISPYKIVRKMYCRYETYTYHIDMVGTRYSEKDFKRILVARFRLYGKK